MESRVLLRRAYNLWRLDVSVDLEGPVVLVPNLYSFWAADDPSHPSLYILGFLIPVRHSVRKLGSLVSITVFHCAFNQWESPHLLYLAF
jgi:hypothetical protein